jgi:hypothetical protein
VPLPRAVQLPDIESIQSIYLVLGFVVPEMALAFVRAHFLTGRVQTLSESIVSHIALTVLLSVPKT